MSIYVTYLVVAAILVVAELFFFRIADKCYIIDKPNQRSWGCALCGDGVAVGFHGLPERVTMDCRTAAHGVSVLDILHDGDHPGRTAGALIQPESILELSGDQGRRSSPVGPGHHECGGVFPVGLLLGFVFDKIKWWQVLLAGVLISFESLQFMLKRGFAEFDDVLHNSLGSLAGYGVFVGALGWARGLGREGGEFDFLMAQEQA